MLPGEFDLYGYRFRWSERENADAERDAASVTLVRMREPFPSEQIDWLTRGHEYIPAYGKIGECSAYQFAGIAAFVFPPDGRYLRIYIDPAAHHDTLEFVLFRGVLPRILHLRGITCLHASAVAVDGGAVVFCGPSGAGKSTLAAALASRGLPLVSDDVVPLRLGLPGSQVLAGPGLPELRVYPSTAQRIGIANQVAAPLRGQTKARWQPRRAPETPLPLSGIYLLEPALDESSAKPASVTPLAPPEALIALISNSYWVHPAETSALGKDMLCLGTLLRAVKVKRLVFELSEAGISAVEDLIASTRVSAR